MFVFSLSDVVNKGRGFIKSVKWEGVLVVGMFFELLFVFDTVASVKVRGGQVMRYTADSCSIIDAGDIIAAIKYTHTCTQTHTRARTHTHIQTSTYVHTHSHTCICAHRYWKGICVDYLKTVILRYTVASKLADILINFLMLSLTTSSKFLNLAC